MFRKRQKKHFPPGTFIPTPARVCAVIQLCLAFSVLFWNASEPFVGEIFTLKSRLLFYQKVMGLKATDQTTQEKTEQLTRNAERFKALPKKTQNSLIDQYQQIQKKLQRSFWDKLKSVAALFAYKISSYELAWIFFSIVLSIMLLKRIEGASHAVWILPLLTALYAADIRWHPQENRGSLDSQLFPSEYELVENYIKEPLSENIFEQHKQMIQGWKRYLIVKWTHQTPSNEQAFFDQQAEEGEFHFTLARLQLRTQQRDFFAFTNAVPPSFFFLVLYFFWNTYFAYTAWKCVRFNHVGALAKQQNFSD